MMQRKPSCAENILEQHQFWRYLSTFSTLFHLFSITKQLCVESFKTKMLEICVLCLNLNPSQFRFHRRIHSYTELASVHSHVKARFPTISSVQSSFLPGRKLFGDGAWAHFLNVGWQSSQGHILDSFATSFLHAAGISKLESVVCGGRLEEMVNFKLSCLIRNDVRCMLFVTYVFFLAVLEF